MAKAKWGAKRICQNCGVKYYDFSKSPVICPSCQTEFDPEAFMRGRRSRAAASLPAVEVHPERADTETIQELTDTPNLTPVEGVEEPDPMDADQPDIETDSEVPDDLDLGPDFEDDDGVAATDDSLLEDDELGDDDLPPVGGIGGSGDDDES